MRAALATVGAVALLAGCGGDDKAAGSQEAVTEALQKQQAKTEASQPSAATARKWPAKWCSIEPGSLKVAIVKAMGQPTERYGGPNPQVIYDGFGQHYTAFFDANGSARQLDGDAGTSSLPCDETRQPPAAEASP